MSFSEYSGKKLLISDQQLEQMLLSLREEENTAVQPPVVNTFRLEMEKERRRSRIQLEIVTIAAFVSVISTAVFTAVFFRFMLPEMIAYSDRRTRGYFLSLKSAAEAAFRQFGSIFIAIALAVLMGYIFSAVLLIAKRDRFFSDKNSFDSRL